jgi:hypothetical protein
LSLTFVGAASKIGGSGLSLTAIESRKRYFEALGFNNSRADSPVTKAVLTTKIDPTYDDLPEQRYHFPRTYLRQVEAAKGDFIIYYEPRRASGDLSSRGGRQAYFATARIVEVVSLDCGFIVVRSFEAIPPARITSTLMSTLISTSPDRCRFAIGRPFREAAFAGSIKAAYDDTCAFTGLKIINGGGRSEVQAAHIRPVNSSGPDSIRNGIALCGTVHWMFDRGLISIADNHELLFANGNVPEPVMALLNSDRRLLAPSRAEQAPHPIFLRWHRENGL